MDRRLENTLERLQVMVNTDRQPDLHPKASKLMEFTGPLYLWTVRGNVITDYSSSSYIAVYLCILDYQLKENKRGYVEATLTIHD